LKLWAERLNLEYLRKNENFPVLFFYSILVFIAMEKFTHPLSTSKEEWLAARRALLAKEKEYTRLRDKISAERRSLPWRKIDKLYVFQGPGGPTALSDLFQNRSQLIVQHFMFGPGWKEGCPGCSFGADHVEGAFLHLEHHDVSFAAVSRTSLENIEAFKKRMGWHFNWVSSLDSDFNFDFNVSFTKEELAKGDVFYNYGMQKSQEEELPGMSVFHKDREGGIFHTYSTYARGTEEMATAFMYLDITPMGRNENGPNYSLGDWVRHHDRYDASNKSSCCSSEKTQS
jgi:predicted dithiol-disulfide oxidoreductase (DUF899 family)